MILKQRVINLLTNFEFLMEKFKINKVDEILEDFELAKERFEDILEDETFFIYDRFISSNKHILKRGNNEWDASKIFFQLSIEHADNSPLTIDAEAYEKEEKVSWDYVRNVNRNKKYFLSAIKAKNTIFSNVGIWDVKEFDEKSLAVYDEEVDEHKFFLLSKENLSVQREFELNSSIWNYKILDDYIVIHSDNMTFNLFTKDMQFQDKLENIQTYRVFDDVVILVDSQNKVLLYNLKTKKVELHYDSKHFDEINGIIYTNSHIITWISHKPEEDEDFFLNSEDEDIGDEYIEYDKNKIDYTEGKDVSVRIYDKERKKLIIFDDFDDFIDKVIFLENKQAILVITGSYSFYIIDLNLLKIKFLSKYEDLYVVDSNSKYIIIIYSDEYNNYIDIFDVETMKKKILKIELELPDIILESNIDFINEETCIIGGNFGYICVIDLKKAKIIQQFQAIQTHIEHISILNNGDIVIKDINDTLIIFDKNTLKPKTIHKEQTHFDFFEIDSGIVVYGSFIGVVLIDKNISNYETFNKKNQLLSPIFQNFKYDDTLFITTLNGELLQIDLSTMQFIYRENLFKDMFEIKKLLNNNVLLYEILENSIIYLFDVVNKKIIKAVNVYKDEDTINNVEIYNNKIFIFPSLSNEKLHLKIYDFSLKFIKKLKLNEEFGEIISHIFLKEKELLILGYKFGLLQIWDIKKFKLLKEKEIGEFKQLEAFDSQIIFVIDTDLDIHILDYKFKQKKYIEFGNFTAIEDSSITIEKFNNYYIFSSTFGTKIVDIEYKIVLELENYCYEKAINNMLILKNIKAHKYKIFNKNLQEIDCFNIDERFKEDKIYLKELGFTFWIGNEIFIEKTGNIINEFYSQNVKYFFDGFRSFMYEYEDTIVFENKGIIKKLKIISKEEK